MRRLVPLLLALCACPDKRTPDAGSPLPPYPVPTLKCTLIEPAGWKVSAAPMPDHVLEMLATAPKLRGHLVVRESASLSIAAATEDAKLRTTAAWGTQPDFTMLREDPFGEGRLVAYQWRPQATAPIERHLIAILPMDAKVLLIWVDDDGETPERVLLASIATMKCQAK